jgi:hypothetical protein
MEKADGSNLYRVDFFGMQPRYLFGDVDLIKSGLLRIYDSLSKLRREEANVVNPTFRSEKDARNAPHSLIQMQYIPKTRSFYRFFISKMMCDIIYKYLQDAQRELFTALLQKAVGPCAFLHYPFFEKDALMKINTGFKGHIRELEDDHKGVNTFVYDSGSSATREIKYFYHKYRGRFCTFHFDYRETELLGYNIITYMLKYKYSKMVLASYYEGCPVIDGVSVSITKCKYSSNKRLVQNVKVDFIQVTTGKTHGVSPSGLFAMLVMLASIKNLVTSVEVNFLYVVSNELFMTFESNEASLLYTLFKEYGIKVKVVTSIESQDTNKTKNVIHQNPINNVEKKEENKVTKVVEEKSIKKKKKKKKRKRC